MPPSVPRHSPSAEGWGKSAQAEALARPAGPAATPEPCGTTLALARLVIHATAGVLEGGTGIHRALGRWRLWGRQVTRHHPLPTRIEVADLQGRAVFTTDDLCPSTGMPLPAGTYHVTVHESGHLRRYTVALQQGTTFNLHLHPLPRGAD